MQTFKSYSSYLQNAINSVDEKEINQLCDLLFDAYTNEKMVFVIGNGGSAANASHFAQDLAKGTRPHLASAKRIKALSLADNIAFISALGNDDGYDTKFEQQLRTFAKPGDLLVAISGSGNSPNILAAINWANENGLTTIGITGFGGGKLKELNHHSMHVPLNDMCTAESVHSVLLHYVVLALSEKLKAQEV